MFGEISPAVQQLPVSSVNSFTSGLSSLLSPVTLCHSVVRPSVVFIPSPETHDDPTLLSHWFRSVSMVTAEGHEPGPEEPGPVLLPLCDAVLRPVIVSLLWWRLDAYLLILGC